MKTPDEIKNGLELQPCPFCGKTDLLRIISYGFERYGVECLNCQVKQGQWHGLAVAIDAWNRRDGDVENS